MRKTLIAVAVLVFVLLGFNASAQVGRLYQVFTNGVLPPMTTNQVIIVAVTNLYGLPGTPTNLLQDVHAFDNVGFTLQYTGTAAATNAAIGAYIFRSYDDGNIWETTPGFTFTNITLAASAASGFTQQVTTNLYVPGVTGLAIVLVNNCTNYVATTPGWATNLVLEFKPKAPKVLTRTSAD